MKDQITKYKKREKEFDNDCNSTFVYVHSDLMSRIITSSSGEKGRSEKKRQIILGVDQDLDYMI